MESNLFRDNLIIFIPFFFITRRNGEVSPNHHLIRPVNLIDYIEVQRDYRQFLEE